MEEEVLVGGEHVAKQLQQMSSAVNTAAGTIVIKSDAEYEQAAAMLLNIKERFKVVDDKRKEFTQPLYDLQKKLNAFFKGPLDDYKAAEAALKSAMAKYVVSKEEARKAALAAAAEAAATQEKATFTEAMEKAADNIAPEAKGTHTRQNFRFEVVDEKLVPRHYCSPDEKKIREAIDALGETGIDITIPGVRIWRETTVVAHGKRGK